MSPASDDDDGFRTGGEMDSHPEPVGDSGEGSLGGLEPLEEALEELEATREEVRQLRQEIRGLRDTIGEAADQPQDAGQARDAPDDDDSGLGLGPAS